MVAFSSCCCCTSEAVETVLVTLLLCVQTDEFKEDCSEVHSGTRKATVMYLVKAPEKLVRTCSTFLFRENKRQVVSCNYVTNPKTTDANLHACKYVCVCVCRTLIWCCLASSMVLRAQQWASCNRCSLLWCSLCISANTEISTCTLRCINSRRVSILFDTIRQYDNLSQSHSGRRCAAEQKVTTKYLHTRCSDYLY